MDKQRQAEVDRLAYEEEKKRLLANKNALNVNYDFSEEEFQSAMMKLTEAAWKYDKTMPGAPSMEAFESREMEPHIFKVIFITSCVSLLCSSNVNHVVFVH